MAIKDIEMIAAKKDPDIRSNPTPNKLTMA